MHLRRLLLGDVDLRHAVQHLRQPQQILPSESRAKIQVTVLQSLAPQLSNIKETIAVPRLGSISQNPKDNNDRLYPFLITLVSCLAQLKSIKLMGNKKISLGPISQGAGAVEAAFLVAVPTVHCTD